MDRRLDQATRLIENERAQIGHEIHDALLPLIFAASAAVSRLLDDAGEPSLTLDRADAETDRRQRLQQTATWLDEAMQVGRRMLTQVYPPDLVGTNWTGAAASAVERLLGDPTSIVHWDLDPQINGLDSSAALAAYRIVIESIRNAVRHGEATRIDVRGRRDGQQWLIEITDNGRGFDQGAIPDDRFGVRSMIGRAQLAGGTLTIDTQPGGPTTIACRLPVSG